MCLLVVVQCMLEWIFFASLWSSACLNYAFIFSLVKCHQSFFMHMRCWKKNLRPLLIFVSDVYDVGWIIGAGRLVCFLCLLLVPKPNVSLAYNKVKASKANYWFVTSNHIIEAWRSMPPMMFTFICSLLYYLSKLMQHVWVLQKSDDWMLCCVQWLSTWSLLQLAWLPWPSPWVFPGASYKKFSSYDNGIATFNSRTNSKPGTNTITLW